MKTRRILCFGNPLHGDDGFGPAVYARLARLARPPGLELYDAGTAGLAALTLFAHCDEAWIVDALAPAGDPGRIHRPDAARLEAERAAVGHGLGVGYLIRALDTLGEPPPRLSVIAAEAAEIAPFRLGLSAPVARAVEQVAAELAPLFAGGAS